LLVKVVGFGLNRMDILQRMGRYPVPAGTSPIMGVEFSGIVEATGESVIRFAQGDKVFGLVSGGCYAEVWELRAPAFSYPMLS
jgi:NADPH:quinone reductase-like Zn-dependent oxidoreductase